MDNGPSLTAALVKKARECVAKDTSARRAIERANADIAEAQDTLTTLFRTAELFSIDLAEEVAKAIASEQQSGGHFWPDPSRVSAHHILLPRLSAQRPTVRQFILEVAQAAYPEPVRASALRQLYKDRYGQDVHEKTFGMTLYRMGQRHGSMRREGRVDWYFVPKSERPAGMPDDDTDDFQLEFKQSEHAL